MVNQYRAFWSVPNAGPCVTTFHAGSDTITSSGAQHLATETRALFADLAAYIPNDVTVSFDSEVVKINTATGQLEDSMGVTPGAAVAGTVSGNWAAGSGARLVWSTGVIRGGRRVMGSTFLVPLAAANYTNEGRIGVTAGNAMTGFANDFLTALEAQPSAALVVYSRPRPGNPGAVSPVTTGVCSAQVATLRGRKY